jgi:hypothetical protein
MLRDPSHCRRRLAQCLPCTLIAALAVAGCGGDSQSDTTPVVPGASTKRQGDMYNFMKDQGKVKGAPKATPKKAPTDAPKEE